MGAHHHHGGHAGHGGAHAHAGHLHAHDEAHERDHRHLPGGRGAQRALAIALALTGGFAIVEAIGAWLAGSLALLSDAGHMLTDAASLGIALFAQHIAARPPSHRASYGYARAEVLAAFVNALALFALVVFIAVEAVQRLLHPTDVEGGWVLGIATAGLAVNVLAAWVLSQASGSLNARGALLHVLSDLLGSVAAIVAGAVIVWTGWMPIDPILSIAVSLLIVRSTWRLLVESIRVLMEGVPAHLDYEEIGRALTEVRGITSVHDLHVWHMSAESIALSAHVTLQDGEAWLAVLAAAQRLLAERFGIRHVTLQPSWPGPLALGDRRIIPIAPSGDSVTSG
jgi:cobalt-zinc-cadmium efflux system protein